MLPHALIHQRLRVARLVGFVVAEAAEANHVQDHVLVELLPVIERDLQRAISRFDGSSPLMWKIGNCVIRATSVE